MHELELADVVKLAQRGAQLLDELKIVEGDQVADPASPASILD